MAIEPESGPTKRLKDMLTKWRSMLGTSVTAPLYVAIEVEELAEKWDQYKSSVGDIACATWFNQELGATYKLAYFLRRARAVKATGPIGKRLHHETAVWLVGRVADQLMLRRCVEKCMQHAKDKNKGDPINVAIARKVLKDLIGKTEGRSSVCARCKRIEEWAKKNGVELP